MDYANIFLKGYELIDFYNTRDKAKVKKACKIAYWLSVLGRKHKKQLEKTVHDFDYMYIRVYNFYVFNNKWSYWEK